MITLIAGIILFSIIFSIINIRQKPENKKSLCILYGVFGGLFAGAVFSVAVSLIIALYYPKINTGEKEKKILPVVNQGIFIGSQKVGNVLLIFDGNYYSFSCEDKNFKANNNSKVYKDKLRLKISENDEMAFIEIREKQILTGWITLFVISEEFEESNVVIYEAMVPEDKILFIKKS